MNKPKILVVDIETCPGLAWIWNMRDDYITLDRLVDPGRIICWSAKWIGKKEMYYADERSGTLPMLEQIHALLSEADAVVTYNGDKFDLAKLNGEFIKYNIPPVPPVASIDLYKTVKTLGLMSGKLEFVALYYEIGSKIKHEGMPLWIKCMEWEDKAWKRMTRYNKMDVKLTDRAYRLFRPYIKNHPYLGDKVKHTEYECPRCQSDKYQLRGFRRTKGFMIQRVQCLACGGWYDGTRKKVTINVTN